MADLNLGAGPVVNAGTQIKNWLANAGTVAGDTCYFGAGVFTMDVAIGNITKDVDFIGVGSDSNPASNTILEGAQSTAFLFANGSGGISTSNRQTVQGIRIKDTTSYAIRFNAGNPYPTLENFKIENVKLENCVHGLQVGTKTSVNYVEYIDCDFSGIITRSVFYAQDGTIPNETANYHSFTNCSFGSGTSKTYIEKLSNSTFENCTFKTSTNDDEPVIDINLKHGIYENIVINNCTFTATNAAPGNKWWTGAVYIKARADGGYAANPATLDGLTITNCTISVTDSNMGLIALGEGSAAIDTIFNIEITNCNLTGSRNGILDLRTTVTDPEGTGQIDARNNAWGAVDGPGIGSYYDGGTMSWVNFSTIIDPNTEAVANGGGSGISSIAGTILFDPWVPQAPEYNYSAAGSTTGLTPEIMAGVQSNGNLASGSPIDHIAHNPKLGPLCIWHRTGGYTPSQAAQGMSGGRNSSGQIGHKYGK